MFYQSFTTITFGKKSVRHKRTTGSIHFKVPIRLMKRRDCGVKTGKIGLQRVYSTVQYSTAQCSTYGQIILLQTFFSVIITRDPVIFSSIILSFSSSIDIFICSLTFVCTYRGVRTFSQRRISGYYRGPWIGPFQHFPPRSRNHKNGNGK